MPNASTVARVMAHVNRYFEAGPPEEGGFTVTDGQLPQVMPDSWVAISGGTATGVWHADEDGRLTGLPDERFEGRLWLLEPPADFLRLCGEIEAWTEAHPPSGLTSEHIGSYSRTMATAPGGAPVGWQQVFAAELSSWRRMYTEVKL